MKKYYYAPKVDKPNWERIPVATLEHTQWLPATDINASAQVCYNDTTIFVRMEAEEKDIRAVVNTPLGMVCEDSCLEFFFSPLEDDPRFFNFEWNPNGALYLGFGSDKENHIRQIASNIQDLFAPNTYQTGNSWGIEFQIPKSFVSLYMPEFRIAGKMLCNFYKCGECTTSPHYMSWNPICSDLPDYYRKQDFGVLVFV